MCGSTASPSTSMRAVRSSFLPRAGTASRTPATASCTRWRSSRRRAPPSATSTIPRPCSRSEGRASACSTLTALTGSRNDYRGPPGSARLRQGRRDSMTVAAVPAETKIYRAGQGASTGAVDADPITTEIIRHGLNSAAEQMKRALIRTAFSPVIYEVLDFAVAIYDRQIRLLAQAPSLPTFMGTMSFCVDAAVEAVGGVEALEPGDIVLYNYPYGTGSHPQDASFVMPVFHRDEELIGYATIKGHWLDIGGKEPYSTDTVDVFQEGTIFPGVKLYSRGELVRDIYRMALANSRVPKMVAGDINAEVVSARTGAAAFLRIVERYGLETFQNSVERMFDHGEAVVRSYFEKLPDGRYVGQGVMDDDGISDEQVPFEVVLEVEGSNIRLDYSNSPDAQVGP